MSSSIAILCAGQTPDGGCRSDRVSPNVDCDRSLGPRFPSVFSGPGSAREHGWMAAEVVLTRWETDRSVHETAVRGAVGTARNAVRGYVGYEEWPTSTHPMIRREVARCGIALIVGFGDRIDVWDATNGPSRSLAAFVVGNQSHASLTQLGGHQHGVQVEVSVAGAVALFGRVSDLNDMAVPIDAVLDRWERGWWSRSATPQRGRSASHSSTMSSPRVSSSTATELATPSRPRCPGCDASWWRPAVKLESNRSWTRRGGVAESSPSVSAHSSACHPRPTPASCAQARPGLARRCGERSDIGRCGHGVRVLRPVSCHAGLRGPGRMQPSGVDGRMDWRTGSQVSPRRRDGRLCTVTI